jgi:hypothetical protein
MDDYTVVAHTQSVKLPVVNRLGDMADHEEERMVFDPEQIGACGRRRSKI